MRSSRIVLGEPEETDACQMESDLHTIGLQVSVCTDLNAVLVELLRSESVCVISDRLPGGEGVRGVTAVRIQDENVPVIVLLESTRTELVFEAFHAGADLVLCKPIAVNEWRALFGML